MIGDLTGRVRLLNDSDEMGRGQGCVLEVEVEQAEASLYVIFDGKQEGNAKITSWRRMRLEDAKRFDIMFTLKG